MKILSPAKINLVLRILGQRTDGYHLLQTYFQLLNWGDVIEFNLRPHSEIIIEGDFANLKTSDNLIYKAIKLLEPFKQINQGLKLLVNKNIPQGSGLGGGSSNAGTTLRIVNQLWQCNLTQKQLQAIAIKLGADVPIFVANQSSWATGIGENLEPFQAQHRYFVLLFPQNSISTVDIFKHPDLIRNQKPIEHESLSSQQSWSNACTKVVLSNYPAVKKVFDTASQFTKTHMSGTGSTLFCAFKNQVEAQNFQYKLPINWHTVLCQSKKVEKS